ncbi:MAG: hypothetical protein LBR72_02250, partial [Oscillospiraceae bacterium]|nr:hypothetical protein [Oscillospiraceae bacterium]
MAVKKITEYESVSRRVAYGLGMMFPESPPAGYKKLHGLLALLIDRLYETPALLNLTDSKDETYESWQLNNMKPELDKIYQSVCKSIYEFYKFLYIASLHGEINGKTLTVNGTLLKECKAVYKPFYKDILTEIGLEVDKEKTEIRISAEPDVLQSLQTLAEKVPV